MATSGGKVGIGTSEPGGKLEVQSNANATLNGDGVLVVSSTHGGKLAFSSSNIQRSYRGLTSNLAINAYGGKVGIGTLNPKATLHVAQGANVGANSGGTLVLGSHSAEVAFGSRVIQARANGSPSYLVLNPHGGQVRAPSLRNIGDKANMQYNTTTGEIGYDNSSLRYKSNISTLHDEWKKILRARPVKYDRPSSSGDWEYGYIAEEMDSIGLTNLVFYDQDGLPENFNYEKMILYLNEVIKMHERDNLELRIRVEELENVVKREVLKIPH